MSRLLNTAIWILDITLYLLIIYDMYQFGIAFKAEEPITMLYHLGWAIVLLLSIISSLTLGQRK